MQLFSFPLNKLSEEYRAFPIFETRFFRFFFTNLLVTIILGAIFFVPVLVYAQTPDFGLDYGSAIGLGTQDIRETVARIIKITLGVLGIIVTLIIMYGGFIWMTAAGNEEKISLAKKIILNGAIGLLIIILAYALTVWIFRVIIGGTTASNGSCSDGQISGCTRCVGGTWIYDNTLPGCILSGVDFRVKNIQTTHGGNNPNQNVYLCSRIQSNFNNRILAQSVADALNANQLRIDTFSGDWQLASNVLTLKHNDNLFTANTAYRLLLPKQGNVNPLQDQTNLSLTQCNPIVGCASTFEHFTWDFTTGEENDDIEPQITNTYPISDTTDPTYPDRNVSRVPIFEVYFSENIDATSVADSNGNPLPGVVTLERLSGQNGAVDLTIPNNQIEIYFDDDGFRFKLIDPNLLDSFRWYRITVQGVEDLCGNQMAAPQVWEFQTNDSVPGVRSWYPMGTNQCTDVDVIVGFNSSMFDQRVTFVITGSDSTVYSASINPSLLEPGPYQVAGSGGSLTVADSGSPYSNNFKSFVFTPTSSWNSNTTYTVTITTDLVINTSGATLSHSWTFSTSDANSCACAPYIMSVNPNQGMAGQCVTVQGRCFTGTPANPAKITSATINGQTVTIGGFDKNYFTATVPDNLSVGTQAPIVETITYQDPNLGSITSNDNVTYYVNQPGIYTGPCLWSIVPSLGCVDTSVTLSGVRFGADPGNYDTNQNNVTFNLNRRARQTDFTEWSDLHIKTKVPIATVDGNVFVTASSTTTNNIPFDMSCGSGGPCSADPNICDPNPTSCALGYECNTSCICQAIGGNIGNPCSSDSNSCVPDDTLCASNLFCDPSSCTCQLDDTGGSSFRVSVTWPSCDGACVNSEIGARFSATVNEDTLKLDDSVLLWLCGDDDICLSGTPQTINISYNVAAREIYIYPSSNLQNNRRYRVLLTDRILSNTNTAIQNLNFDRDNNGSNDSYSWTFTTLANSCALTSVETSPVTITFNGVGQNKSIYGRALSDQQCGPNQYVNPWAYDWKWRDTNLETIARVSNRDTWRDTNLETIARVSNRDTNNDNLYDPNQIVTSVSSGNTQIIGEVDSFSDITKVIVNSSGGGIGLDCDLDTNTKQCELNNDVCSKSGLVCDPNANCTCQQASSTQLTPGVVSIIPINNQADVCRNSIVQVTFNQKMDTSSIVWQSTFNINDNDRDDVRGNLNFLTVNNGIYGCNNSQGCTVVRFYPSRPYFGNVVHTITLTTGIKNLTGVTLPTNFVSSFTTGAQICKVSSVDLQPNYHLFTTLNESVVYLVTAKDSKARLLAPIPGFYDWHWQWVKADADNVVNMEKIGILDDRQNIVAQPRNGLARITATAEIVIADKNVGDNVGRKISDSSDAEVFICAYPWPEMPPMNDYQYGFQMKYCRGNDETNLFGRLSDPASSIISLTTTDPDLKREYLFNYLPNSLPTPIFDKKPFFLLNKLNNYYLGKLIINWWQNLLSLFKFNKQSVWAQMPQDVIGLRIYDNPNNLGPRTWYEQKSFPKGNPQDITVDGFPAIKDGTSVYILGPKRSGSIETYIYVLSYNDLSSQNNIAIFDQLIKNFRFYTLDFNEKPKVVRDLKRLADASFIAAQVEEYKKRTDNYPILTAGSYSVGVSTSKWPSWQATLGNQLGVSMPTDPINKFASYCSNNSNQSCWQDSDCGQGQCLSRCVEGAKPDTCWNEVTQQYSCPTGSAVYQYRRYGTDSFRIGILLEINDYANLPSYLDVNEDYCNDTIYTSEGFCGDGIVQASLGEQCEVGQQNLACNPAWPNYYNPVYQQCENCHWPDEQNLSSCGGYCGDGLLQSSNEVCDGDAGLGGVGPATCYTDCSGFYCNPGYVLIYGSCQPSSSPTVTINSPNNGVTSNGSNVIVQYTVSDAVSASFFVDNSLVGVTNHGSSGTYSFNFKNLTNGSHILQVNVTNSYGSGNDQITHNISAPPVVTILSPTNNSSGGNSVVMQFFINQEATYNILLDGDIVYTAGNNDEVYGAGTYSYTFTNLSKGSHTLGVNVTNSYGSDSDKIIYSKQLEELPASPTSLTTIATSTNVVLNWTDNSNNETSFTIDRSSSVGKLTSWQVDYATVDANITTFTDVGLADNTYYYRVRARNNDGNSDYTNVASAIVMNKGTIFVSSASIRGDIAHYEKGSNYGYGYIENADVFCQNLADASSIVKPGIWRAWISGLSVSNNDIGAKDHLAGYKKSLLYNRQKNNMVLIANEIGDLWKSGVQNSINFTELNTSTSTKVWTGTIGDGSEDLNCSNWSSANKGNKAIVGYSTSTNFWTSYGTETCNNQFSIYCLWYDEGDERLD